MLKRFAVGQQMQNRERSDRVALNKLNLVVAFV